MVKTKERYVCEHCGKELKNRKALAGHLWFAHQKRPGEKADLREKIKILENEPRVSPDVNEGINLLVAKIDELLTKLDQVPDEKKEPLVVKDNPGDPGDESKEPDDDDDGLPNIFGDDDEDDPEKKSKKTDEPDDDESWFL